MRGLVLGMASLCLTSAVSGAEQLVPIRRGCQVSDDGVNTDTAVQFAGKTTRRQNYPSNFTVDVNFHIASTEAEADLVTDEIVDAQWKVLHDSFAKYNINLRLNSTERIVDNLTGSAFLINEGNGWVYHEEEYDAYLKATRKGGYDAMNLYFYSSYSPGATGWCQFPTVITDPDSWTFYKDSCQISAMTMPGFTVEQGGFEEWNQGHLAVHEAGHWFGLNHTFAGGCSDNPGDFVADTPAQRWEVYGCPTDSDSCPDQPGLDPVHNFMGYTSDACTNEFTAGQKDRMFSTFFGWRRK
ncbi:metalloprotease [Colletotrichum incanum]|uniref:Metalloprotease n=1 Tax=Colletotrichum incanum TaxID=1573173 RepID=A0A166Q1X3_COLIC|nr:metalloprotease [Colletotrichum incanum]